jgi:PAS domain-containing protein
MSMEKYQILLTNDDGIKSPGLWAAAEALSDLGYVTVAAPRDQSSGMGRSLPAGSDGVIRPEVLNVCGKDWTVYAVGGSPAQAVLHGIFEISGFVVAGALGVLTGVLRNESERRNYLEDALISERDRLKEILEKMGNGVAIIGPDYKVRFLNSSMVADLVRVRVNTVTSICIAAALLVKPASYQVFEERAREEHACRLEG